MRIDAYRLDKMCISHDNGHMHAWQLFTVQRYIYMYHSLDEFLKLNQS